MKGQGHAMKVSSAQIDSTPPGTMSSCPYTARPGTKRERETARLQLRGRKVQRIAAVVRREHVPESIAIRDSKRLATDHLE